MLIKKAFGKRDIVKGGFLKGMLILLFPWYCKWEEEEMLNFFFGDR
jgi:hypothetical protein